MKIAPPPAFRAPPVTSNTMKVFVKVFPIIPARSACLTQRPRPDCRGAFHFSAAVEAAEISRDGLFKSDGGIRLIQKLRHRAFSVPKKVTIRIDRGAVEVLALYDFLGGDIVDGAIEQ